jgi:DNA-binding FrmR family transcriptional regulator
LERERASRDEEVARAVEAAVAAVRAELAGAGKAILKQHIEHCIVDAIRDEDEEAITKMNRAIDRFMK